MFPPLHAPAHPGRASVRSPRHGSRASFSCQFWPNESLTLKYVLLRNHHSSVFPLTPANIPSGQRTDPSAAFRRPEMPCGYGETGIGRQPIAPVPKIRTVEYGVVIVFINYLLARTV